MSFDYDEIKAKEGEHSSWWTSYADLFMMLSIVFLLMYVTSSLRQGTAGALQQQEFKALAKRAADLEQQIKVYNTLKEQELSQKSEDEQQVYANLMDKLSLLQEEAKEEKDALRAKAAENEKKERALNQYQQIVRNIINANVLAKSQIQNRDKIIVEKEETLQKKEVLIAEKQRQVASLENEISANQSKIEDINAQLDKKIQQLKKEQKWAKISKKSLEAKVARLKEQSSEEIRALESKNREVDQQLAQVKDALDSTSTALNKSRSQLEAAQAKYRSQIETLKANHEARMKADKAEFEREMGKLHLSAEAKAKRLSEFAAAERKKADSLASEIAGLQSKVKDSEQRLQGVEAEKGRALAQAEDLQKANQAIRGDLDRVQANATARREMARRIADNFEKAGIKAEVDGKTGQVTLDFGNEYFDTGSDILKPAMKNAIDRFFPTYTRSLLSDAKTADQIANVEIIGFASSTFRGKYVNPHSVDPADRDAINYNLKLSFARANAIFKHVLSGNGLNPNDQKRFLPLVKVVGRGYLPEGRNPAEIPKGIPEEEFCARYNCKKAQRVIVKFNLKD